MSGAEPEEAPIVDLPRERIMCSVHGEPFREGWPSGYPLFAAEGFSRFLAKPETVIASGGTVAGAAVLLDERPLCCRFERAELLDLFYWVNQQTKHARWPRGRCVNCRKNLFGGPFQALDPETGEPRAYSHICLRCVVFNVERGAP